MNKNLFRIVFNRKRGCRVAVPETAASHPTGTGASDPPGTGHSKPGAVRVGLALALIVSGPALGQTNTRIETHAAHPAAQSATVLRTANGVVQVDIRTPSPAGVSRNTFSRFDVGPDGVILNNSRGAVQSQLGGWVQGNPWLATGTARVILNEVQGTDPSLLRGAVEVAGQRAEVIVANPAGISVNGGSFINASGVTLTTGTALITDGSLDQWRVNGGTVRIDGLGLDTRSADHTAILARAVEVNAGVWAQALKVVTGANDIAVQDGQPLGRVQALPAPAGRAAPAFALDVSALGGMYAGKIILVGTEAGLGVNNAGLLHAAEGALTLSTEGRLDNTGRVQASEVALHAAHIRQAGTVVADADLSLTSTAGQVHSGTVAAGGHLRIAATANAGAIEADSHTLWAAGLSADGQVLPGRDLSVHAQGTLQVAGQALASRHLDLQGSGVDLAGARLQADSLRLHARTSGIDATGSHIVAADRLQLHTPQALVTDRAQVQAARLDIQAQALSNREGLLVQSGTQDQVLALAGDLDNRGGTIHSAAGHLSIDAHSVANAGGQLVHAGEGSFRLRADRLGNEAIFDASSEDATSRIASAGTLRIHAQDFANGGDVTAAGELHAQVGSLAQDGTLYAGASQVLEVQGTLANTGLVAAGGHLAVRSGVLDNAGGHIQGGELDIRAGRIDNTRGLVRQTGTGDRLARIESGGAIDSTGGRIIAAADELTLTAGGRLDNTGGLIVHSAAGQLTVEAAALDNTGGQVIGQGVLHMTSPGAIRNQDGLLHGNQGLSLRAARIDNLQTSSDTLAALQSGSGNVRVETHRLDNSGTIHAAGDLHARVSDLDNSGLLRAGHRLDLAATGSIRTRGLLAASSEIAVDAGALLDNRDGRIGADRVSLEAGHLDNRGGQVHAIDTLDVLSTGRIDNAQGELLSGERLRLRAQSLAGAGQVVSLGDLSLSLEGDHAPAGSLMAGRDLHLGTTGTLTHRVSVQAGRDLHIAAAHIDNQAEGEFVAGRRAEFDITGRFTNRGLVDAPDTRIRADAVDNVGTGRLYGDRIGIAATTLTNREEAAGSTTRAATLAARERLDLGVQSLTNREQALVYSGGDMAIGGGLDAQWQVDAMQGPALSVENSSATIEAGRDLHLSAQRIRNSNEHFATEIRLVSEESVTLYQHQSGISYSATDNSTRFMPEQVTIHTCESQCMTSPAGTSDSYIQYDFVRTVRETAVTQSAPARIVAGGNIVIEQGQLVNDRSQVVAGGTLINRGAPTLNLDQKGVRVTTEVGVATKYWRHPRSRPRRDETHHSRSVHEPAPAEETIDLGVWSIQDNATVHSAHAAPSATALAPVIAQPVEPPVGANTDSPALPPVQPAEQPVAQVPAPTPATVRTVEPRLALPTTSLYRQHPEPGTAYLIETDPRFTQHRQWLGSDYMLQALQLDPALTIKRLGDGFHEQQLVREQVMVLTGHRFIGDHRSDEEAFQALMDNGLTFAREWNLRPGVELSAAQVAQLTSDIVWLVSREVTLADGSRQSVLVPQVYARVRPGDVDGSGALLSGRNVLMDLQGDLHNSGTIAARETLRISADSIRNQGGTFSADRLAMAALTDIDHRGGRIEAQRAALLTAGRDIILATTTRSGANTVGDNRFAHTGIDRVARVVVGAPDGTLAIRSGRDLTLSGAQVANAGTGGTLLSAGRNLDLAAVGTSSSQELHWGSASHLRQSQSQDVGSQVTAGGNLALRAGQDLSARAAHVQAGQDLALSAGRDITIASGEARQTLDTASQTSSRGTFSRRTLTTRSSSDSTTALASQFEGASVQVEAGRDLTVGGSAIMADQDIHLQASGNVTLEAARNTHVQSSLREESRSGLMRSGGIGVTAGQRTQSLEQQSETTTAAASTFGSVGGNVSIRAGGTYTQTGSDILTPQGDIQVEASRIAIVEARETETQHSEQRFRQSGLTLALTGPVLDSLQGAGRQLDAAGQTSSGRMQALAAANAALNVRQAANELAAGQAATNGNAADRAGGLSASLSIGSSRSASQQSATSDTARGSTLTAGGSVRLQATGAGAASTLTVRGSQVQAADTVTLKADGAIDLAAARNTHEETRSSSSSSASVGVAMNLGAGHSGFGVTASASRSTGQGSSQSLTHTNTHISGERVHIQSGGDTTLRGAVVSGNQVRADIGGHLVIESLQDTHQHTERSRSEGGSVTVGPASGGSLSASRTAIDSSHQSVTEQSAIRAGDGGFTVNVQGTTRLIGGQITSTQAAVDAGRNTFDSASVTTIDIDNRAEFSARGASLGVGVGRDTSGSTTPRGTSAGFGSDRGSAASVSTAGISGFAGDASVRTGDAEAGLGRIFDADRVRSEVGAQLEITASFGSQAARLIGDYAGQRYADAVKAGDQAGMQAWAEGGAARVALHGVVGALTGGLGGAAGAVSSQAAIDAVAQQIAATDLPPALQQTLTAAAGTLIGAAAGGGAGAASGFNATTNNYLSHVRPDMMRLSERERYERAARECAEGNPAACTTRTELALLSASRDRELAAACDGRSADLCREAVARATDMGNIVQTSPGRVVIAISPNTGPIQALNPSTLAPITRPDNFHDELARSTAEGLVAEVGGLAAGAVAGAALRGVQASAGPVAAATAEALAPIANAAARGAEVTADAIRGFFRASGVEIPEAVAARVANNFGRDGDRFTQVAEEMAGARSAGWRRPNGDVWWPPGNGAVPGSESQVVLPAGTRLDRYGRVASNTDFLAPAGTPVGQRALAPSADSEPLITFEVLRPLPVQQSNSMPWFNQPGMGIQYQTTTGATGRTITQLIQQGYLRVVK